MSRQVRQYWPLTIVTFAFIWGLPFLTGQTEKKPGLAGISGRSFIQSDEDDSFFVQPQAKAQAGYLRPDGVLPFYGFDRVMLESPIFKSWWDGKTAVAGAKLKELHANTIVLGPIWKDSLKFHDTVARMHGNGVKIIVQVTSARDWVDLADDLSGKPQPIPNTFVEGRATHVLAEARNQGVGHFADFILIGGEALSYATHFQRQKMYQIVKKYFPQTPIVRRYGLGLEKAESLQGKAHPMGGTWDEYRFGAAECDMAIVQVGRGVEETRAGVRVKGVLEQLNHQVSIIKSRAGETAIVVSAAFGDERLLGNSKSSMWSSKEIDQFVSAILTSAGIDGLLMYGMGHYTYDLGHPEFEAQRQAFRDAAPSISPVEAAENSIRAERSPASF